MCDLSAVYGVSGKSDAMVVVALLFCFLSTYYHSSRKPQCVKLRVRAEPDAPKVPYAADLRHSFPLAHRCLAIDHKRIRVMYNAVTNGICQNGITDLVSLNISSLSDTPDRKKSDTLTAKILHPFRIDGAWRPHGLRTAATPLDHSEIAFSRLMDSPLMVST